MARAVQAIAGVIAVAYGTWTGNPAIVKFGYGLIISNVLSEIALALAGKPFAKRYGADVEYSGTVEPRRIIFGQMKVSGMNVLPPYTSGANNSSLHQVLAIAGHEVEEIGDIYLDQNTLSGNSSPLTIGPVTGTSNDGAVLLGDYAGKAWIRRYLGTSTQAADSILVSALTPWTTSHRGLGVAYIAAKFEYDETVYRGGKPDLSALVKGKKVYDPRLDTSPGANPTNASYIAYSSNPALCLADYLTDDDLGVGEVPTRIDWDTVVAAADICDEQVAVPPAASPTNYQNRYTCNIVMYAATEDDQRRANIDSLVTAMMGHIIYRGGKWRMYAGAAQSTEFALTEDDLVGKVSLRTETPSSEKYNFVRGQFIDKDRNYQLSEFPPQQDPGSPSYEGIDGAQLPKEVMFTACTDTWEAQRNAIIVLKRSRLKRQATLELGMSAYRIRPWDVGTVTLSDLGWDAQTVRCMSWNFRPDGVIEATFLEEDSAVWDDPAVGDYTEPSSLTPPTQADYIPDPVESFTATSIADGIYFNWNPADTNPIGTRWRIYEYTASKPFSSASVVLDNIIGNGVQLTKSDTTTRYYWITALYYSNESTEFPSTSPEAGVAGKALAITTGFRLSVAPSTASGSEIGYSGWPAVTIYTNSVTGTATNGTPTYTYAWTWASGGTGITINSASSATTTFRSTSTMAVGAYLSGVARCTATDAESPMNSAYVDVPVSLEHINND